MSGDRPAGDADVSEIRYQTPTVAGEAPSLPWGDHDRADDKTELLLTAARLADTTDDGVAFPKLVRAVFGEDVESGGTDWRLAHRMVDRDLFRTSKPYGNLLYVEPTDEALSLIRSMDEPTTGPTDEESTPSWLRSDAPPRERAARVLQSQPRLLTDRQRGLVLKQLAYHCGTVTAEHGGTRWVQKEGQVAREKVARFHAQQQG